MAQRKIIVSPPVLDPALDRVRNLAKLSLASLRRIQATTTAELLRSMGIDAVVTVRPGARAGEETRLVGAWDDIESFLAVTASEVAAEALVRLLGRLANRLGSAGELPGGDRK